MTRPVRCLPVTWRLPVTCPGHLPAWGGRVQARLRSPSVSAHFSVPVSRTSADDFSWRTASLVSGRLSPVHEEVRWLGR